MRRAIPILVLGLAIAAVAPPPAAHAARCKMLSYGYVGFSRSGTTGFVRSQLAKKIDAWKAERNLPSARVGATDVSCKKYLQVGSFVEWECHAKAKVCG